MRFTDKELKGAVSRRKQNDHLHVPGIPAGKKCYTVAGWSTKQDSAGNELCDEERCFARQSKVSAYQRYEVLVNDEGKLFNPLEDERGPKTRFVQTNEKCFALYTYFLRGGCTQDKYLTMAEKERPEQQNGIRLTEVA